MHQEAFYGVMRATLSGDKTAATITVGAIPPLLMEIIQKKQPTRSEVAGRCGVLCANHAAVVECYSLRTLLFVRGVAVFGITTFRAILCGFFGIIQLRRALVLDV